MFMLQNLKMGFTLMALYSAGVAGVRMLAAPLWGRALDRVGAQPVLVFCSFGISVLPALWIFPTPHFLWPILADVVISGVLWGGHGLAAFALPLAVAPRQGRPFYLAAFATTGGVAFTLASAGGGWLAQTLPAQVHAFGRPLVALQLVFVISSLARFARRLPRVPGDRVRSAASRRPALPDARAGRPLDAALGARCPCAASAASTGPPRDAPPRHDGAAGGQAPRRASMSLLQRRRLGIGRRRRLGLGVVAARVDLGLVGALALGARPPPLVRGVDCGCVAWSVLWPSVPEPPVAWPELPSSTTSTWLLAWAPLWPWPCFAEASGLDWSSSLVPIVGSVVWVSYVWPPD